MASDVAFQSYDLNSIIWRSSTMDDLKDTDWRVFGTLASSTDVSIWEHIECRGKYLQTAFIALLRSVYHIGLTVLSTLILVCEPGRQWWKENAVHALIDLSGVTIGVVGTFSPYLAHVLLDKEIAWLSPKKEAPKPDRYEYELVMFPETVNEVIPTPGAGRDEEEQSVLPLGAGGYKAYPDDLDGIDVSGMDHKHSNPS